MCLNLDAEVQHGEGKKKRRSSSIGLDIDDVKQIIFMSLMMCNERMLRVSDLIKESIDVHNALRFGT